MIKAVRKRLEVLLVRAGLKVVTPRSRRAVLRMAAVLGWLAWLVSVDRRRVGRANLDQVFGARLTPRAKRRLLQRSFETMALTVLDMFWFSRDTAERVRRWVRLDPSFERVLQPGPLVCVTAHLANWEVLGLATAERGQKLVTVAAPIKNPAVDALLMQSRRLTGQAMVPRQGAAQALLRALRRGETIALVLDQNTRPSHGGMFVDFFGLPATMSTAGALLAHRTQTELFFGFCRREADGGYRAYSSGTLSPTLLRRDRIDEDVVALTQRIAGVIEREILAQPEAWMWMYKRWKRIRPGDSPSRYPRYSTPLPPSFFPPRQRSLSRHPRSSTPLPPD